MGTNNIVFLENLEWFDDTGKELVHRLPQKGSGEIKYGAQLTVRESQAGVFYYQGKAIDAFGPGRHTLKTANIPILKHFRIYRRPRRISSLIGNRDQEVKKSIEWREKIRNFSCFPRICNLFVTSRVVVFLLKEEGIPAGQINKNGASLSELAKYAQRTEIRARRDYDARGFPLLHDLCTWH